ncbi:hypothetical protein BTJ39_23565 [Izhakiella australiensis]|uniref:Peptidase S24/S26A/S26B/S26C domain-containing protein n=1 Tax=Izhakiella australiensis TaxID=1926881 RepID=A0A1S8Y761_9GAMM|nr:hypothetical protein [Izhakiella australiensis]OON34678.1 hypothetical protein BTJ39_23565 [Izhakiella australiensis]
MGFPSPAADYVEQRLSLDMICNVTANTLIIETCDGYAIVDTSIPVRQGRTALISFCGQDRFAVLRGRAFITDDGEAIEGEALSEVVVRGVVTHTIIAHRGGNAPF